MLYQSSGDGSGRKRPMKSGLDDWTIDGALWRGCFDVDERESG
jgi:hypothetical protein